MIFREVAITELIKFGANATGINGGSGHFCRCWTLRIHKAVRAKLSQRFFISIFFGIAPNDKTIDVLLSYLRRLMFPDVSAGAGPRLSPQLKVLMTGTLD